MAQSVAVVRGTITGVSTGTSDFTRAGFGTPTAAIIIVGDTNDSANPRDGARIGVGFWDGTNQAGVGFSSADAQATTATNRDADTTYGYTLPVYTGSAVTAAYGSITSVTDGIRITNLNSTDERHCTVILLSGVSASVKTLTINNTNGGTVGSGSLGFEPRIALMATVGNTGSNPASAGILSLSVAEEGGAHRGIGFASLDAAADAAVNQLYSETRLVGQLYNGWNAWNAEVTTWGTDSITLTTRDGASGSDLAYFLILGGADLSYHVGTVTTRTSTGTDTISTTGIDPDAVLMMVGTTGTAGSIVSDSRANGLMIGAADDSGQYSHSIYDEDGAATSNTGTVSSAAQVLNLDSSASGSRTDLATATVALGTGGFSLDYSAADATARKGWFLAFGPASGGGGPGAVLEGSATAAASASGAITTAIQLAGAAILSAASTGSLSTAVQLAAQALAGGQALGDLSTAITLQGAVATATLASGDLSAQIRLDGAALAAAIASAGLTASILLAAAAQGGAQAAGSLSTGEGLEGVATGAAQATGSLTTLIVLSGAAVAALLASGDLSTTPSGLVGAATAGAQASGAITTAIPLAGGAQVSVIATGDAATGVTLAGAAVAVVAATGDLVIALELSAQALASAIAGADLTTAVVMRADAVVGAQAGGTLAGVVYIASTRRTYVAPRRVRRAIAGMR
jgi:hypothetical protein